MAAAEHSELRAVAAELLVERDRRQILEAVVLRLADAAGLDASGLLEPDRPALFSESLARPPKPPVDKPVQPLKRFFDAHASVDGLDLLPPDRQAAALAAREATARAIKAVDGDPLRDGGDNHHRLGLRPARKAKT